MEERTKEQKLLDAIHGAVSNTYIDGEYARLSSRLALKEAAGWITDHERQELMDRMKELRNE